MSDVKIKNGSDALIKDSSDLAKNHVSGAEDIYTQQVSRPPPPPLRGKAPIRLYSHVR